MSDITQAVKETVLVESQRKLGRSQTQNPSPPKSPLNGRRSHSQDSAPPVVDKKGKSKSKKGSQHADVIDRLDFTGVGPMFHHDGPFDACAPSRNRQKSKAPMMAWTPSLEDPKDNPYPSQDAYKAFSDSYEAPKKKVDAIAEAWGIHEPEPFEEFFAGGGTRGDTPASSIYNGKDSNRMKQNKDAANGSSRSRGNRRSTVPPPQPIFISEPVPEANAPGGSPVPTSTAFPKRSKSIMQRIRKMRDAPNVPVGGDYEEPQPPSPSSPPKDSAIQGKQEGSDPFVYVDARPNKDLPVTPGRTPGEGTNAYFEPANGTSPDIGRKTSIMKKMGRVVRGTR